MASDLSFRVDRPYHSLDTLQYTHPDVLANQGSIELLKLAQAQSAPNVSQTEQPAPDEPYTDAEYKAAAKLLDKFIGQQTAKEQRVRRMSKGYLDANAALNELRDGFESVDLGVGNENRHRVYSLAYDTLKFLKYIDNILIKTEFLSHHCDLLGDPFNLALIKVVLYEAMKHHFEFGSDNGVRYAIHAKRDPIVVEVIHAVQSHKIKLAAAYARMRIEKRAAGSNPKEMLMNILPEEVRQQDAKADGMKKYMRVNTLKTNRASIVTQLEKAGFTIAQGLSQTLSNSVSYIHIEDHRKDNEKEEVISVDKDFENLLIMPANAFNSLAESDFVRQGFLVPQDKVSCIAAVQIAQVLTDSLPCVILDARAGNGLRASHLASVLSNRGRIFAVESRAARVDSMQRQFEVCNVKNAEIIPEQFLKLEPTDEKFKDVSIIILEPPNSGTSIADQFSHVMQEEELPSAEYDALNLAALQQHQIEMLQHAVKFPNVKFILYLTRSTQFEENEEPLCDILDESDMHLIPVLPQFANEECEEFEFDECLKIEGSDYGNGIYVACLERNPPPPPEPEAPTRPATPVDDPEVTKKKRRKRSLKNKKRRQYQRHLDTYGTDEQRKTHRRRVGSSSDVDDKRTSRRRTSSVTSLNKSSTRRARHSRNRLSSLSDSSDDDEEDVEEVEPPADSEEGKRIAYERKIGIRKPRQVELLVQGLSLEKYFQSARQHVSLPNADSTGSVNFEHHDSDLHLNKTLLAVVSGKKPVPLVISRQRLVPFPVPNPHPWKNYYMQLATRYNETQNPKCNVSLVCDSSIAQSTIRVKLIDDSELVYDMKTYKSVPELQASIERRVRPLVEKQRDQEQ